MMLIQLKRINIYQAIKETKKLYQIPFAITSYSNVGSTLRVVCWPTMNVV